MSRDYCVIEQLQSELQKQTAEAQLNCVMNRKRKMEYM